MQVKDNVNASNFLQGSSQLGNTTNASKSDKKKEEINFSSFLISAGSNGNTSGISDNKDISKNQNSAVSIMETSVMTDKAEDSRKTAKEEKSLTENDLSKESKTIAEKEDSTVSDDTVSKANEVDASEVSTTESDVSEGISDEEQEVVLETVSQILQMIMNQFQLSTEELNAKLDEFGMDVASLLTGEGMREFFLNMESADVSDLLVNEELNQKLQEFMDGFNQIMEQMESVEESLDFIRSDVDFASLLMKDSQLQEAETETDFISSEKTLSDSESSDGIVEEPEVIVSKTETTKNTENQTGEQKEETSFSMSQQTSAPTEKSSTNKENKFENPILQALDNAVSQTQGNIAVTNDGMVSGSDVIRQIVEQVRLNMNQNTTSMELQLNPEHLGKVQINVAAKEGVMTARIVVETEAARQAVEGGLTSLKETLEQQNLKVDAIEVMVSTTGFEGQEEKQDSYKKESETKSRKKLDLADLEDDVSQGEEAETLKMEASGSSVSYSA